MENTFQVSIEMPPVPQAGLNQYWHALIRAPAGREAEPDTREFDDAARAQFDGLSTLDDVLAALEMIPDAGPAADAWRRAAMRRLNSPDLEQALHHALEPFGSLVESNPRSMKRLVNSYGVERALRVRTGTMLGSAARTQNVLWTIVRLRWPVLAEHLSRHPEHADILAGNAAVTDFDPVPEELKTLFVDIDVRRVFRGEGVEAALDADGVRQFLQWGTAPSTVGA